MRRCLAVLTVSMLLVTACGSSSTDEAGAVSQRNTQVFRTAVNDVAPGIYLLLSEEQLLQLGEALCLVAAAANTREELLLGVAVAMRSGGLERYARELGGVTGAAISQLCPEHRRLLK